MKPQVDALFTLPSHVARITEKAGRERRPFVAVRKDLPAHAISTKNKHLLLSCDTNPRFHGGSFGV